MTPKQPKRRGCCNCRHLIAQRRQKEGGLVVFHAPAAIDSFQSLGLESIVEVPAKEGEAVRVRRHEGGKNHCAIAQSPTTGRGLANFSHGR